ncbi:hypothetical protein GC101_06090 [Paenibacillus sp. LMG 31459]|uniref:YhfM-like domain-containing protein n=1 Tax=Paenibacillus phytohabitans TaxID=2654978 RepID=A0ABX1YBV3_9BACL|nr:hypothetical protein [Paenibacillus phytohabitans]NOU78448.1 hypothetical protein [Paenibacillus phytohabitans]
MEPIRRLLLILPVLLVVLLSGCQNAFGYINSRWISEIDLTYNSIESQAETAPFESRIFKDGEFIKTMASAMNTSKRIAGELDYDADFSMKLVYGDGYTEDFILGLGQEEGSSGLLLSAERNGTGYKVSAKNADKLRKLIFSGGSPAAAKSEAEEASVVTQGPVTVSRNDLYPVTGNKEFLNLQLLKGSYSEDWSIASPLAGRSWSGQFRLAITDEQGAALGTFALSRHFTEELSFGDLFQIQFADYNGDGNPDFTVGQYGSSNGSLFKLFTVKPDHSIQELQIKGAASGLFISSPDRYSVKLDVIEGGFRADHYDNALGRQVETSYRWDGAAFQEVAGESTDKRGM